MISPLVILANDLWATLEMELVSPEDINYRFIIDEYKNQDSADVYSIKYTFQHDRVQQAAAELLSQSEYEEIHLKIGRLMLEKKTTARNFYLRLLIILI